MAKSIKNPFSEFNKRLDKLADESKMEVELKGFSDISEYIDTGNFMLNAALTGSIFGGYPNARSVCIAGEPSTGKTFLCLNAAREAQKMGYYIMYVDTEGAIDQKDFVSFGVDLSKLRYIRLGTVSDVKFAVASAIKVIKDMKAEDPELKFMLFVDSIGQLETGKERNDAVEGKDTSDMGLRAKQLRAAFRNFTLDLSNLKVPMIFTNHLGDDPANMYAGKKTGGGKGPEYAASTIIYLGKGTLKDGEVKTGIIVKIMIKKNRLAKPIEGIEIHISHLKGMNRYVGLQQFMSWEGCGIARGKKLNEKEFSKLSDADKAKAKPFKVGEEQFYLIESNQAKNYIIKWTGDAVPVKYLFTSQVFTKKVLEELDENVIKPTFKYATMSEILADEERDLDLSGDLDEEELTENEE